MGTMDRWLCRRFLGAYLLFVCSGGFLYLIIDLFSKLDSLLHHAGGLRQALMERYGTMLPELYFVLSPHLVLLAGLWTVVTLVRKRELISLYMAGYGPRRIALPLLAMAMCLAVVSWADRELLLPRLGGLHKAREFRQLREAVRPVADGHGGSLSALYYLPSQEVLVFPRYVVLSPEGEEVLSVFGERATYDEERGAWLFVGGFRVGARPDGVARPASASTALVTPLPSEGGWIKTTIRRSDVEASIVSPSYLSSQQLREQLERTPGFRSLEIQIYERFTQPLAGLALLLAGLPIVLGVGGNLYLRGLGCLGLGVGYFFGATICRELGAREVLPPLMAAGLPVAFAGLLGVIGFSRV
ncbi:MAG: LptF/LptG family permease [Planctomycetes bacterium]|nr:LptF/LptG family permease [Planctomycetota bacterium]